MRTFTVLIMIVGVLFSVGLCQAAGYESGDFIEVSLPVGNDLYVAGGRIVVSEPVAGDLVAAGGSLIFNGPVNEDLQVAGGSILVNSSVTDDLRAAGGDIVISSSVGGDLIVFGGNVTIPAGAVVEGDALIGAGNLYLGGTVRGNVLAHTGTLDLTGTVLGDARLYAEDNVSINGRVKGRTVFAGSKVKLGPAARFEKDVSYWREDGEIDFGQVLLGGQARFDPDLKIKRGRYASPVQKRRVLKGLGGFFIGTLFSGIAIIILSILLLKSVFRKAGETLHRSYLHSTGIGVLTFLLLPLAGFLAMVTIVGIPVGILLMAVFVFSLIFGRIIAAMAFAAWMERRRVSEWSTGRLMLVSIGFYVAIKLVSLVPFVGWLVVSLAVMAGYGAVVLGIWRGRQVT